MLTCRLFTHGPQLLHVHDNPGSITDANRCDANGWDVDVFKCQELDLPFTMGDGMRPIQVVDIIWRVV